MGVISLAGEQLKPGALQSDNMHGKIPWGRVCSTVGLGVYCVFALFAAFLHCSRMIPVPTFHPVTAILSRPFWSDAIPWCYLPDVRVVSRVGNRTTIRGHPVEESAIASVLSDSQRRCLDHLGAACNGSARAMNLRCAQSIAVSQQALASRVSRTHPCQPSRSGTPCLTCPLAAVVRHGVPDLPATVPIRPPPPSSVNTATGKSASRSPSGSGPPVRSWTWPVKRLQSRRHVRPSTTSRVSAQTASAHERSEPLQAGFQAACQPGQQPRHNGYHDSLLVRKSPLLGKGETCSARDPSTASGKYVPRREARAGVAAVARLARRPAVSDADRAAHGPIAGPGPAVGRGGRLDLQPGEQLLPPGEIDRAAVVRIDQAEVPKLLALVDVGHARAK